MRVSELRDMTDQELELKEHELKETVFRLRLRRGTNQLDNPSALLHARRDIARVKTIQTERARAPRTGQVG